MTYRIVDLWTGRVVHAGVSLAQADALCVLLNGYDDGRYEARP